MQMDALVKDSVHFVITNEQLNTGLRGFPVGYCPTSDVDPYNGLSYAGFPIASLRDASPEEVIFLLYYRRKGSEAEVANFKKDLASRSYLLEETIDAIYNLPVAAHPMQLFCMAIELLGIYEGAQDYHEDCLNLIAKIPLLTAHVINHHAGWDRPTKSEEYKGYIENFFSMLGVPNKTPEMLEIFRLFNILHYDHGGGNLSTFVGKAVASGLEDMYGSISSAMHALAGPRHGRANQDCLEFVGLISKDLGNRASEETVEKAIRDKLAKKELVFGFGHAVLRVEDARATILYEVAERHFKEDPLVKTALLLRKAGPKVLKENPRISNPYPNVDAISGVVLSGAGFPFPEYYTVLFGMSRTVGIAIQIVYERKEGKVPIYRPDYIYIEQPLEKK